ncbi:ABC transporter substrate-binding protein [Herbaspirillum sp. SJZ107]|uniref:ABC transporter substrate-binding protein n=1 Tax=Herbaspirillum sp. SJZ107 TaxID=2572881 RepID=UPI0011543614|nr:ABC transporter substrate-binding protein [Herbaspirillum sp. SJZ107]TQK04765.1 amino acid/amide ABC transporter substrate-binding protein (HAAT family) [Herbaspirillum sp. SJZ107]
MPYRHATHAVIRALACSLLLGGLAQAAGVRPVLLGIDGEFGLDNSTSAQAVELGMRTAVQEINAAGGVLHGRPLQVVVKDHRSIPARGIRNIQEFAKMPDLVAVFGGRFSPVVIEELPTLKAIRLPFMAAWSSADAIVDNAMQPNYVYRLSLRDSLAMPTLLAAARRRRLERVGLLMTNTSWGRSNAAAAERALPKLPGMKIVGTSWYNWRDASLVAKYSQLRAAGAQAIVLVANDDEAAVLVREVAALPKAQRLPILSHWGVTGGEFTAQAGPALQQVDFSVIQTFSFYKADPARVKRFLASAATVSNVKRIEDIQGPVGVAHAYDLTHILARAIDLAGSTDRRAVRDALERVGSHRGLVKDYAPPFTPARHEALGPEQLLMARYRADGVLVPAQD